MPDIYRYTVYMWYWNFMEGMIKKKMYKQASWENNGGGEDWKKTHLYNSLLCNCKKEWGRYILTKEDTQDAWGFKKTKTVDSLVVRKGFLNMTPKPNTIKL